MNSRLHLLTFVGQIGKFPILLKWLFTLFLPFEDREAALPLEEFIQCLDPCLEWYLQHRYFTHNILGGSNLTK